MSPRMLLSFGPLPLLIELHPFPQILHPNHHESGNGDNEGDTPSLTNAFTVASDFQRLQFHFYG